MNVNTIVRGDCFELMKGMPDNSVDVTFTSPPYNRKRNDKYANYDDNIDDYLGWLERLTAELRRVTKGHVFINIQKNYYNKRDVLRYLGNHAEEIVEIFVWGKSNPMPASGKNITNAYEFIVVIGDAPLKSNETYTKNMLITSVNSNMTRKHKAVMKPEVAEFFISNFTKEGDVVLDPLLGLGTTAIACKRLNRSYIGFEINEEYCDIAIDRVNSEVK